MSAVTLMKTPAEIELAHAFETARTRLPGDVKKRDKAFTLFAESGLPHRRVEDFKYTDLRALMPEAAPLAEPVDLERVRAAALQGAAFGAVDVYEILFVNGRLVEPLQGSLPSGVDVTSLDAALAKDDPRLAFLGPVEEAQSNPLYNLNTAFMGDGAVISVAGDPDRPLHLRFLTIGEAPLATMARVLVLTEEGSHVTLLESHENGGDLAHQHNDALDLIVPDRARVDHVRLSAQSPSAIALSTLTVTLGEKAHFATTNFAVGSAVSRHQVFLSFLGAHSHARIDGVTLVKGRQHADTTLVVRHAAEHCESRELFKTAIDDDAVGVFQGKIVVEAHAQKTDGRMMSAALLLSDGGSMNNKPELEIFADDVQCAHGATSGQLDEDLLFYMRARGLPKEEAERLLVQAFLSEAIENIAHEGVRDILGHAVEGWLLQRAG